MAAPSRSRWSLEALDVLERRGAMLWAVVVVVVVAGALTAFVLPELVPPTPLVGVAVAVAGLLLGVAVVTAVDAGDAVVRGPRHVRAAGGELVGVLPAAVAPEGADELAAAVLDARPDRRLTLGLAGAQAATPTSAWAGALATALARRGASVLLVDLANGASPQDGILEVLEGDRALARTVELDPELKLARIDAGRDLDAALRAATLLPERLPRDLEVLLVALPAIAKGEVLDAASALDTVLVLTASGRTRRARLQAAVAAIEAGGTAAQVVLVDDRLAAASSPAAGPRRGRDVDDDPAADPREPGVPDTAASEAPATSGPAGPDEADGAASSKRATATTDAADSAPPQSSAAAASAASGAARSAPDTREDATVSLPPADRDRPRPASDDSTRQQASDDAPPVTDATHLGAAAVDPVVGSDQAEAGAASPVDLSASPRSTVRLVRGVEPSPRRPLRPPTDPRSPAPPRSAPAPSEPSRSDEPSPSGGPPRSDEPSRLEEPPQDEPPRSPSEDEPAPPGDLEGDRDDDARPAADHGDPADATAVLEVRDPDDVRAARGAAALGAIAAASDAPQVPDSPEAPEAREAREGREGPGEPDGPDAPGTAPTSAGDEDAAHRASPAVDPTPPTSPEARAEPAEDALAAGPVEHGDGDVELAAGDVATDVEVVAGEAPAVEEDPDPAEHAAAGSIDEPFEGVDTGPVAGAADEDLPRTLRGDDEDDPLRTTAQLAIVLDQIEDRDDPST